MATTSDAATLLLQSGLIIGAVLLAHAYATRHRLTALAGDAMLTADGRYLQPASGSFSDVTDYLRAAAAHLHQLGRRHQVIALTV